MQTRGKRWYARQGDGHSVIPGSGRHWTGQAGWAVSWPSSRSAFAHGYPMELLAGASLLGTARDPCGPLDSKNGTTVNKRHASTAFTKQDDQRPMFTPINELPRTRGTEVYPHSMRDSGIRFDSGYLDRCPRNSLVFHQPTGRQQVKPKRLFHE
jgi:hypothetical protein